ncbi:hypothetical protein M0P28_10135 [Streptococcus pasteurianus]|nr:MULTISPECIES: hypothetical protein [Streptococcus]MCH1619090.1 hypothetical protein [Streptococcus gallolyticus]MCI7516437.1 hypothetical protein [Streptococcus sp.]MCO7183699.1 hypothetical protein [Streptococcus gallolyticus]MDV5118251.1 hypothetical protein [Streptococcus pasteurianus]MDV5123995.1 hypothetical protein [Streptococcus pasteurianus]
MDTTANIPQDIFETSNTNIEAIPLAESQDTQDKQVIPELNVASAVPGSVEVIEKNDIHYNSLSAVESNDNSANAAIFEKRFRDFRRW